MRWWTFIQLGNWITTDEFSPELKHAKYTVRQADKRAILIDRRGGKG